jgi:hypothetical protein
MATAPVCKRRWRPRCPFGRLNHQWRPLERFLGRRHQQLQRVPIIWPFRLPNVKPLSLKRYFSREKGGGGRTHLHVYPACFCGGEHSAKSLLSRAEPTTASRLTTPERERISKGCPSLLDQPFQQHAACQDLESRGGCGGALRNTFGGKGRTLQESDDAPYLLGGTACVPPRAVSPVEQATRSKW